MDEEVENTEIVITTLNGLPRSWDSFIRGMCSIRKWLLSSRLREECTQEESQVIIREREDGRNWRSSSHIPKKIPQAMRNTEDSTSYPYYHLDKKWWCHEWRRWWSRRLKKESTHETNKDKYSNVISWYCFDYAFLVYVLCMIECLH